VAAVLEAWDRRYAADSVGADLFARWLVLMTPDRELRGVTAEPWSAHRPLDTPAGLADPVRAAGALSRAARSLLEGAGILSRPWGDVTRAARGEHVTRGHGHLDPFGVFRVSGFVRGEDGVFDTVFGTTFVAAVEFTSPVRARVLLSYGNSSQPGSPHAGDQLDLLARGEYREAWLTRAEVEAHLARREEVGPGAPHVPPPVRTSS
jgi:acyl-homoserine-lactone acylase